MRNDPDERNQREREERFDRFLDIAEAILDEPDIDELGDDPDYEEDDGTEVFAGHDEDGDEEE